MKAEITPGSFGQFDVLVEGERVAGKQAKGLIARLVRSGEFPEESEVVEILRSHPRS